MHVNDLILTNIILLIIFMTSLEVLVRLRQGSGLRLELGLHLKICLFLGIYLYICYIF